MAWIAEEDFESYADEDSLVGATGGSGWSAGWVNSAINLIRADTADFYEGAVSARVVSGGGNTFFTRTVTAITTGTMYVAMKHTGSTGTNSFTLRNSGGGKINVSLNQEGAGKLSTFGGGAWHTMVSPFSTSQWYVVEITFDTDAAEYSMRVHDGSSWSSTFGPYAPTASGNIDRVGIGGDTGDGLSFLDKITATDPTVAPPVVSVLPTPTLLTLGVG